MAQFRRPVLNCACKEDPANLGRDFDATNLDILDYDPEMRKNLYEVPNFVQGTASKLPFPDNSYATVVYGELFEHCVFSVAVAILKEGYRVLKKDGMVVITIPFDPRPPNVQRLFAPLFEYEPGITSFHQTIWKKDTLMKLFAETGFVEVEKHRRKLRYITCDYRDEEGWGCGLVLAKV